MAGIPAGHLDGKGHPCPKCGGTDRFAAFKDVNVRGAVNCRHCFTNGGDGFATVQWLTENTFSESVNWIGAQLDLPQPPCRDEKQRSSSDDLPGAIAALEREYGKCSGQWHYHDLTDIVGMVMRWDLSDGKKKFRPIWHIDGRWKVECPDTRPLYGLHRLSNADVVYIVEGEKCVDAARTIGLTATTSSGGAQVPTKTDWTPLAGKEVVIWPDNDDPGRKFPDTVSEILLDLSPPAQVKVVKPAGLPEHGDIVDWLDMHGEAAEPDELRRQVEDMVKQSGVAEHLEREVDVVSEVLAQQMEG